MIVRFAVIIAMAAYLAPREALDRISQSAYVNSVDVVTLCERRPKDCEIIAEKIKETGVVLAGMATQATTELRERLADSVSQLRQMQDTPAQDHGTLLQQDLMPDWRGS